MKALTLVAALLVASSASPQTPAGAPPIHGLWDATIVVNGVEVPFRFEIAATGRDIQGFFFEGDRKVGSTAGTFVDGVLRLEYDFLNTTLALKLENSELVGTYLNKRANAKPQDVRMRRFTPVVLGTADIPPLAGNWDGL